MYIFYPGISGRTPLVLMVVMRALYHVNQHSLLQVNLKLYIHHRGNFWTVVSLPLTAANFSGTNLRQFYDIQNWNTYPRNTQYLLNCPMIPFSLWMRNFMFKFSDSLMWHFYTRSSTLWLAYLHSFDLGKLLLWMLIKHYLLNIYSIAYYLSMTSYSKKHSMLSIKYSQINDITMLKLGSAARY